MIEEVVGMGSTGCVVDDLADGDVVGGREIGELGGMAEVGDVAVSAEGGVGVADGEKESFVEDCDVGGEGGGIGGGGSGVDGEVEREEDSEGYGDAEHEYGLDNAADGRQVSFDVDSLESDHPDLLLTGMEVVKWKGKSVVKDDRRVDGGQSGPSEQGFRSRTSVESDGRSPSPRVAGTTRSATFARGVVAPSSGPSSPEQIAAMFRSFEEADRQGAARRTEFQQDAIEDALVNGSSSSSVADLYSWVMTEERGRSLESGDTSHTASRESVSETEDPHQTFQAPVDDSNLLDATLPTPSHDVTNDTTIVGGLSLSLEEPGLEPSRLREDMTEQDADHQSPALQHANDSPPPSETISSLVPDVIQFQAPQLNTSVKSGGSTSDPEHSSERRRIPLPTFRGPFRTAPRSPLVPPHEASRLTVQNRRRRRKRLAPDDRYEQSDKNKQDLTLCHPDGVYRAIRWNRFATHLAPEDPSDGAIHGEVPPVPPPRRQGFEIGQLQPRPRSSTACPPQEHLNRSWYRIEGCVERKINRKLAETGKDPSTLINALSSLRMQRYKNYIQAMAKAQGASNGEGAKSQPEPQPEPIPEIETVPEPVVEPVLQPQLKPTPEDALALQQMLEYIPEEFVAGLNGRDHWALSAELVAGWHGEQGWGNQEEYGAGNNDEYVWTDVGDGVEEYCEEVKGEQEAKNDGDDTLVWGQYEGERLAEEGGGGYEEDWYEEGGKLARNVGDDWDEKDGGADEGREDEEEDVNEGEEENGEDDQWEWGRYQGERSAAWDEEGDEDGEEEGDEDGDHEGDEDRDEEVDES
ncbi:hypothetical protein HDU93_007815 [Gonapodya sp. JEL0774]|nr:hypothetical protein HDU93_007815 [Gonapodya sp. JEL0774]